MVAVPLEKYDICAAAAVLTKKCADGMYGWLRAPALAAAPLLSVVGCVSSKYVVATPFVHAGMRGKGVNSR